MRVVTLLPAATEIVAALGGAGQLVGISHECDYPASVQHLPRVTTTPIDIHAAGAAIDADVRRLREANQPVIGIDAGQLSRLAPDLIITQGLCEVCAVADGETHRIARDLPTPPRILSLEARNLE
jgi:iron complex transport system substrate-binding protein